MTINPGHYMEIVLEQIKHQQPELPVITPHASVKRKYSSSCLNSLLSKISGNPSEEKEVPPHLPIPRIECFKSVSQAKKIISAFHTSVGIALSITGGDDPYTNTLEWIALSPSPSVSYIFTPSEVAPSEILVPMFEDPKVCKIMFDSKAVLKKLFVENNLPFRPENIMDISVMEQLMKAGETGVTCDLNQSIFRFFNSNLIPESFVLPNLASRSAIMHKLAKQLWPAIKAEGLTETAALEFDTVLSIALMELQGVFINGSNLSEYKKKQMEQRDKIQDEIFSILSPVHQTSFGQIRHPINLSSRDDLTRALAKIGISIPNDHKETLLSLKDQHPVLDKILQYRDLQYSISSYSNALLKHIHPKTGRIHTHFGQVGTRTGRLNSTDPCLHNIPNNEKRSVIEAAPGNTLIVADYKQIDLVVAAVMSQEENMLSAIINGEDLHLNTALWLTGKTAAADITPEERKKAKAVNFGLLYLMSPSGLVNYAKFTFKVSMSIREAEQAIRMYNERYKDLRKWQSRQIAHANQYHETRTLSGRRRLYHQLEYQFETQSLSSKEIKLLLNFSHREPKVTEKLTSIIIPAGQEEELKALLESFEVSYTSSYAMPNEREVVNSPIQGTGADIIKLAMNKITQSAFSQDSSLRLILNVHDELVGECAIEEVDREKERLKTCMEEAGEYYLKILKPKVDIFVGPNWSVKH